jgi:RNA polymerase sigma-70 factor (ECF subfamily)
VTDRHAKSSRGSEGTSSSLLERARQHDQTAWNQLVDLYSPLVWRWCRQSGLNPPDIEDISQDVFRAVHQGLSRFRKAKPGDSFRAWLRTVTAHRVTDFRRRRGERAVGGSTATASMVEVPDPNDQTIEGADNEQEVGILYRRAVQVLRSEFEDRTWQAFWRVEIDDEPVASVAAALGMTANAVYLARSRIRRRLRALFIELGEEGIMGADHKSESS